nr:unnamed protein product [Spirometra erinaceieuropaei]
MKKKFLSVLAGKYYRLTVFFPEIQGTTEIVIVTYQITITDEKYWLKVEHISTAQSPNRTFGYESDSLSKKSKNDTEVELVWPLQPLPVAVDVSQILCYSVRQEICGYSDPCGLDDFRGKNKAWQSASAAIELKWLLNYRGSPEQQFSLYGRLYRKRDSPALLEDQLFLRLHFQTYLRLRAPASRILHAFHILILQDLLSSVVHRAASLIKGTIPQSQIGDRLFSEKTVMGLRYADIYEASHVSKTDSRLEKSFKFHTRLVRRPRYDL